MNKKNILLALFLFTSASSFVNAQESTCVFFNAGGYADGNTATHYVSKMLHLRYSDDELTYSEEGKKALDTALQKWENSIYSRYDDDPVQSAIVRKPSHLNCVQFERDRLDNINHYKSINGYMVIEW